MSSRVFDQTVLHNFIAKPASERKAIARHLSREERRMLKQLLKSNRNGGQQAKRTVFSKAPVPWVSRRIDELLREDASNSIISERVREVLVSLSQEIDASIEEDEARSVVSMPGSSGAEPDSRERIK